MKISTINNSQPLPHFERVMNLKKSSNLYAVKPHLNQKKIYIEAQKEQMKMIENIKIDLSTIKDTESPKNKKLFPILYLKNHPIVI